MTEAALSDIHAVRERAHRVLEAVRLGLIVASSPVEQADIEPLRLPPVKAKLKGGSGARALQLGFMDHQEAAGEAAEFYGFSAGVSLSRTRGWIPSFRLHLPLGYRPSGRSPSKDQTRPRSGLRDVVKAIEDYCAKHELLPDRGRPYIAAAVQPRRVNSRGRLNGHSVGFDSLHPGAGITTDTQANYGSIGYFVVRREDLAQPIENVCVQRRTVTVGSAKVEVQRPGEPGLGRGADDFDLSEALVLPYSRALEEGVTLYAVGSGHALSQSGRYNTASGQKVYRVLDTTPGKAKFTALCSHEAIGTLAQLEQPKSQVSSEEDFGLVELNTSTAQSARPTLLKGHEDSRLRGLVVDIANVLPETGQGLAQIQAQVRGLGSGLTDAIITCIYQTLMVSSNAGPDLEYRNLVELVGQSQRIGRGGDSGGAVVIAQEGRAYLLGSVALASDEIFDLPEDRFGAANGAVYATLAQTTLRQHNLMLVVEGAA